MGRAVTAWIRVLVWQLWAATVQHQMQVALETPPSWETAIIVKNIPISSKVFCFHDAVDACSCLVSSLNPKVNLL